MVHRSRSVRLMNRQRPGTRGEAGHSEATKRALRGHAQRPSGCVVRIETSCTSTIDVALRTGCAAPNLHTILHRICRQRRHNRWISRAADEASTRQSPHTTTRCVGGREDHGVTMNRNRIQRSARSQTYLIRAHRVPVRLHINKDCGGFNCVCSTR